MYYECRHIMPNGARCHSPALSGKDYCYYHNRLHQRAKPAAPSGARSAAPAEDALKLPDIEDRVAIQVALAQIFDGLASGRIDRHTASVYLYGLQIGLQAVERKQDILPFRSVQSVCLTREGDEVAPKLRVCESSDLCATCNEKDTCNAFDPDQASEES
jgi:hypothetical protein